MQLVQVVLAQPVRCSLVPHKTLLALDQSSRCTGNSVFKDGELIDSGTFDLDDPYFGNRLVQLRTEIIKLCSYHEVNQAAFEDIQLQSNVNPATYKALAEVFGVVEELFTELNIPYEIVHSSSWKSTLGIKGAKRADQKKNAQQYVLNTYNKKVSQDESDAICIGTHIIKKTESAF